MEVAPPPGEARTGAGDGWGQGPRRRPNATHASNLLFILSPSPLPHGVTSAPPGPSAYGPATSGCAGSGGTEARGPAGGRYPGARRGRLRGGTGLGSGAAAAAAAGSGPPKRLPGVAPAHGLACRPLPRRLGDGGSADGAGPGLGSAQVPAPAPVRAEARLSASAGGFFLFGTGGSVLWYLPLQVAVWVERHNPYPAALSKW